MQGQQSAAGSTVTSPQHHGGVSSPPTTISEVPDEGPGSGVGGESYYCIPYIEACALVTLCSYRSVTRRLSLALLKETRLLHEALRVQVHVGGGLATLLFVWTWFMDLNLFAYRVTKPLSGM